MSTTKEKFEAAVNVIKNLPKDGPYQPSNDMKLRFYSLYKQATEGPCQASKPAFWDVVGRVKWEAWRKLGEMTKDEAMQAYIDGLKEIVETMSFTDKIADFMESVGPFYEMVDLPLPKKATSYSDDDDDEDIDKDGSKDSGLTAFIISKNVGKHKQLEFILRAKTKNGDDTNDSEFIGSGVEHDIVNGELGLTKTALNGIGSDAHNVNGLSPNNVNQIANGSLDWSENTSGLQENGHAQYRDGISDKFYSSNESDDEFSDPLDSDIITDEFVTETSFTEYETNTTFVPANDLQTDTPSLQVQQDVNKPVALNGPVSGVKFRGGGDPTSSSFSGRNYVGATGHRSISSGPSNAGLSGAPGNSSMFQRRQGGGGGRRGPQGNTAVYDVTEQIAIALSQLQKDMESVLTRLNTLEALTVAHHHMAQGHLITHGAGSLDPDSFRSLEPELTLLSERIEASKMEDESRLSQYPLRDFINDNNKDTGRNYELDYAEHSRYDEHNYTGVSEGPLTSRSQVDIAIYVPDNDDNLPNNNEATASGFDYNSPTSSSSAYFSLHDDGIVSSSRFSISRDVLLIGRGVETQEIKSHKLSPVKSPSSRSESLTLIPQTDAKEVSGLPEMYLQPMHKCEYEGNADKAEETDDDIVDWPSDNEEMDVESKSNFKDRPRGEPMGSEDIFSSNTATNYNQFATFRSKSFEIDELTSDSEKFSGDESSDDLDLDVNRSYWLRGNIEGSDDNVNLRPQVTTAKVDGGGDVRPPLVGQSEEKNDDLIQSDLDELLTEHQNESQNLMEVDGFTSRLGDDDHLSEAVNNLSDLELPKTDGIANHRSLSPSVSISSVASSKRLEWDSGADIGYGGPKVTYGLSSLERMAIGCSALKKRMEPEGKSCLVNSGPLIPLPITQHPILTDEESVDDEKCNDTKDIFKDVLILKNKTIRSASLSDLSNNKSRIKTSKQHSSSSTDIFTDCPVFGPANIISSSSCSVSTCSSNTVIGIPYNPEDNRLVSPPKTATSGRDDELRSLSSYPTLCVPQPVEPEMQSTYIESVGQNDLAERTKRFVNQCCTNSDDNVKDWIVNKIMEDFSYGLESIQTPESSSTFLFAPIPPPPAFEDPIVPQVSSGIDWERSTSSDARESSSSVELGSPVEMQNDCVDVSSRDSDSSVNTVKEIQQQLASSFEYYDPSKSEINEHKRLTPESSTSTDDKAWIKVLKKDNKHQTPFRKFDHSHYNRRPSKVINSSDDDRFSSNRDFLLKLPTRKPRSIFSTESTISDNYFEEANSLQTVKRFIRRLEVLDSWHPEGVELVKELIQKQRNSYVRRLQREVDWLERMERILSIKPATSGRDFEPTISHLKRDGYKNKPKKPLSGTKTVKDFAQCYPTPVPTDSESGCCSKLHNKIQKCSVGIQTTRSESHSPITFLRKPTEYGSPQLIPEKERPVVSVPLNKMNSSPNKHSKSASALVKGKERVRLENPKPVAWFLPIGNGQPKVLLSGRRGVADGQHSGAADIRTSSGRKYAWASKSVYSLPLQESFKMLKPNTIKRVESRQRRLKMEVELRKRVGNYNIGLDNHFQKVFHRVTVPLPISVQHHKPQKRMISHYEMREQTEKIYNELPEITAKKELKMRENIYRTNRLMANMFRKKLQGRVLKGQVSHLTNKKCV